MIGLVEPQHLDARQRSAREVIRALALVDGQPDRLCLAPLARQPPEVGVRNRQPEVLADDLARLPVVERQDRAQHLVAGEHRIDRALEHAGVEAAAMADRRLDVVERVAGAEAIEEPQALLRERERCGPGAGAARDPVAARRALLAQQPGEQLLAAVAERAHPRS
jgi:hypothetical protein